MKKYSQACTLDCFDCCKLNVYVENSKVIKIEGDKNHPFTKGFICKKGHAHLDRLNHKDRIYKPLLKINGDWKEISFEDALNIISDKLKDYKNKYSSKSILYYEQYGNGSLLKSIGEIFFNFFGGVTTAKGGPCWSAGMNATKYDFGDAKGHSLEDMLNSKSIFIWGKNPAHTTIHTMQILHKAKKQGIPIIVIDPIFTDTAKIADKYIKIAPGTDGALALAMAKLIIDNNLIDNNFINSYVLGFNEFKDYLSNISIGYLCNECGVSYNDVNDLVTFYTNIPSTIHVGYGMQKYSNGGNSVRAINALGALTGQIGISGGGVNYANKVYPSILNCNPYNSSYNNGREFYVSNISDFINKCNNSQNVIPIKMAVITKSNLLNQLPNLSSLEKAFSSIEFKVCIDMFMTDTACKCDLFIPCSSTLESEDLVYSSMTNPYITYNEKTIDPAHILMDEYYFFMELAKRLKINNYPFVSKYDYLSKVIEPLKKYDSKLTLESLNNKPFTIHSQIAWQDKKFETPSGKFELYSNNALKEGSTALPSYIPGVLHPKNKFRLITTHHKDTLFSQHKMDKDSICKCYINESMALKLGISNKEIVKLSADDNFITCELNINNDISDFIVQIYVGWWKKHGNPNFITSSGISDMGGQITYNDSFIKIEKFI